MERATGIECMHADSRKSRRRLLTTWCVMTTTVLAVGCGQSTSVGGDHRAGPGESVKVDDVTIRPTDSGLMIQYRTRISSRDCNAQAAEMPEVWNQVVKARLTDSVLRRVVLFPEDPSGQSVSFEFTKNASGRWSASGPCVISIPGG